MPPGRCLKCGKKIPKSKLWWLCKQCRAENMGGYGEDGNYYPGFEWFAAEVRIEDVRDLWDPTWNDEDILSGIIASQVVDPNDFEWMQKQGEGE